jgi:hypothetical protein
MLIYVNIGFYLFILFFMVYLGINLYFVVYVSVMLFIIFCNDLYIRIRGIDVINM